jgi:deoxyribose-phosphate aldolase
MTEDKQMMPISPLELAAYIDHTYLKPDATAQTIQMLCEEAVLHGFYSVCVNGMWVSSAREWLSGAQTRISAVCGFPLGAMEESVLAFEAETAVLSGASELDMVLPVGALLAGDNSKVERHIRAVVKSAGQAAIVKVILETGYLNDEQKQLACRISEEAGAHYVKTSTGFGPGGATVSDIRLMRASVSDSIGVKASGGVRDYAAALAMIEAGATRIGTSSGAKIIQGASSSESGHAGY